MAKLGPAEQCRPSYCSYSVFLLFPAWFHAFIHITETSRNLALILPVTVLQLGFHDAQVHRYPSPSSNSNWSALPGHHSFCLHGV